MDSPRPESPAAPALRGMVGAWVGVFAGAAVTALVWKYPLVVVGAVGAGLGWLVRGRGRWWSLGAGVAAGVVLAVAAGVIAVLVG